MRKLLALFAATLIAATGVPRAEAAVSVDFFYTSLEPHGAWMETPDYGYVWQPSDLADDWRPYTVGSWAYTDAGWTWVSEEPHGWVTHHYGRWILVEPAGWVWVPDTEWAPAWVSWRRSTTHVGWAPLPPEARFERTVGIKTWTDSYYDIGPTYYSFVEVRNIGAPRLATVVLPPQENITIIRETQNITNIVVQNNIIINEGPKYDVIVRESAQPIRRLRLERQTDIVIDDVRRGERRGRIEGDVFRVTAPEVQITEDVRPPRVERRLEKANVNRGWKGLEQRPEAKELRARMQKETAQPAGLPPEPKFERIAERAKRQRGPQDSTEIPEDAAKPKGDQPVVGTEPEMKERDGGKRRPAKTEAPEDAPADAAATTEQDRANRRDRNKRAGQADAPDKPADPAKPDAATPDATTPDASATDRQNRRMRERERAAAKDADKAKTAAEDDAAPADAPKSRNAADKVKMEADDAAKATTETGESAATEAKTRREAADAAKSEAKAKREAAEASKTNAETGKNADEQKQRRGAAEARSREESRSEEKAASEAASPATSADKPADSSNRRSAAERMERSPGAAAGANEQRERANRPERPDRPERAERPDRPERAERADRPERAERPDRPAAAERPNRPNRPQGGDNAPGAERRNGGGGGGAAAAEGNRGGERRGGGGGNANERGGGNAPE